MTKTLLLRAITLMAVAVPGLAAAEEYQDPNPYVVDSNKYPYTWYPNSYQMNDRYSWETSTYAFDYNRTYTPSEQDVVIQDETAITGATQLEDWTDGSIILQIEQATIPEAFTHMVPGPSEAVPTNDTAEVFSKSYSRTERFGNSIFGAGYALNASITATSATSAAAKKVDASAEGKVFATAFSYEKEIVRGTASISGQQGGTNSGSARLFAMGQEIWSTNLYYTFAPPPIDWSRTFFSVSKTFMVGPVPLSVKASMAGGVKLAVTGEIGPTVAKLDLKPGGWSNAMASASVNIIIAKFGVEGSLTLVNVTVPSYGELFWPYCTLNWDLRSTLNLNTLSGVLKLYAQVKFLFFKKTWRVTIASWAGITRNWTLLNQSGSKDLGFCSSGTESYAMNEAYAQ